MKLSQSQLKTLSENLNSKIPDLLNHFGINFVEHDDRYTFACPIHGGDNENGACIYKQTGIYRCWTHSCHNGGQNTLNFIQAVWSRKRNKAVTFPETIDWSCKYLGKKLEPEKYVEGPINDVYKQNRLLEVFNKKPAVEMAAISREAVLRNLDIPSKYFIGRGFSKEVLTIFDVGDCDGAGKMMAGRAVVPVYDIHGKYVGCSGRATEKFKDMKPKWLHSKGFYKSHHLYGINIALESIIKHRAVFLVEGPGDVWRMHEAGFPNTVAILGAALSDDQLTILESLLIEKLYLATDSDAAGESAFNQIIRKCGRRFNYQRIMVENKDIGATSIEDIQNLIRNQ